MKKILVIGDIILDKYTYGTIKRLNPEGPYPLLNIIKDEFGYYIKSEDLKIS